jgi:DNA-binding SARP family transcriptional activator/TolB-like protein
VKRLSTFGGLSVLDETGNAIAALSVRRRSLAVLAVVAASGPRGISRDKLIGIFWPESDFERARNALKQIHFSLRRDLGHTDLFLPTAELLLDPTVISSDIAEFNAAKSAGDTETIARLYVGPFLEGVHIRNGPEFDRWVDAERASAQAAALAAMQRIAVRAQAQDDLDAAVSWWRRAAALVPADSEVALGLLRALKKKGDYAGLLKHASAHAAFLRTELDCEPNDALLAFIDNVRTAQHSKPASLLRSNERQVSPPDNLAGAAEINATPPEEKTDQAKPRRTRYWLASAAAAVSLAAVVGIAWVRDGRSDTDRTAGPPPAIIAIAPFRIDPGDKTTEFLRDGMVDLLSSTLSGGDSNWRVVDPGLILKAWRDRAGNRDTQRDFQLPDVIRVARDVGATRIVRGTVIETRNRLVLTASLIDVLSGSSVGEVEVSGGIDSIPLLIDRLAAELMGVQAGEQAATVSVLTGTPLPAVRAYLASRTAFRRSEYAKAVLLQENALQLDSTFALAAVALARTAGWLGDDDARLHAYKIAWANKWRLGPVDRAVLSAVLGPRYPEGSTRTEWLDAWEKVAALQPDRPEGWYEIGDLFFHSPWLAGGDEEEGLRRARVLLARALEQGPTYWPAFQHVIQLAAHFRDTVALRRLWSQASAASLNSDLDSYLRWRVAAALGDSAALKIAWLRLNRASSLALGWVAMTSQQDGLPLGDARRAVDLQLARAATEEERIDALQAEHALALNEGEFGAATRALRGIEAAQDGSMLSAELAVIDMIFGGVPFDSVTSPAAQSLESALARIPRGTTDFRATSVVGRCFLGHWYVMRHQIALATHSISELRDLRVRFPKELWSAEADNCALLLDASLALDRGDRRTGAELDSLSAQLAGGPYMTSQLLWDVTVLASARLFEKAGDKTRARTAVRQRNSFTRLPNLLAPQLLETARLSLALGDRSAAVREYEHYLALRDDPDPSLVPERRRAEQALASLRRVAKNRR